MSTKFLLFFFGLLFPQVVLAYIGPGMGAGAIAGALGVIGAIFLVLFAVLYYPIKRVLGKRKNRNERQADSEKDTFAKQNKNSEEDTLSEEV